MEPDLTTCSIVLTHRDKLTEINVRRLTPSSVYAADGRRFSREDGRSLGVPPGAEYEHPFLTPATLHELQEWPEEWQRPKDARRKLPHLLPVLRNEFRLRSVVTPDEVTALGYSGEEVQRLLTELTRVGEIERSADGVGYVGKLTYPIELTQQPIPPEKQPPLIVKVIDTDKLLASMRPKVGLMVRENSDTQGTEAYADPSIAHSAKYCRCGCETRCKSTFAPGHDARFFGRANRIQLGTPRPTDLQVPEQVLRDMQTCEIPTHYRKGAKH